MPRLAPAISATRNGSPSEIVAIERKVRYLIIRCQGKLCYCASVQPQTDPIGLEVARTGRVLSLQFNDALAAGGGSLPQWLILTALKRGSHTMQHDIASAI